MKEITKIEPEKFVSRSEYQEKISELKSIIEDLKAFSEIHSHRGIKDTILSHRDLKDIDILDHFPSDKQIVISFFESLDGWTTTSGVNAVLGGGNLQTGTTANTERSANIEITGPSEIDFDNKNPQFKTILSLSSTTNQLAYWGCGDLHIGDGTEEGFGFKVDGGSLYAISTQSDGVSSLSSTVEIIGITLTNANEYKAIMDSGPPKRINYYVNGLLKATITSNMPDGTNPVLYGFYIKNTEAVNKVLYIRSIIFIQDN